METNRLEFNKAGLKTVSAGVQIVQHVAGRIRELNRLYNDIVTTKSEMLLHQMLPNHMRRRAMSHNPKRLPQKYRFIHVNQMAKSGPTAKKRRPSRKYRRKPYNLMKEYTRRKQKNVWLETHLWHSKRYHMQDLWGYKIPFAQTDKRYRASYKATANHCLLQDMSFFSAIEVNGNLEVLKEGFKRITSQECGLTLMAKSFQNGVREGDVDLFKQDSYPSKALGNVSFIWKPTDNLVKTLWIFIHPSAYQNILEELIKLFHLKNLIRGDDKLEDVKATTRNDSMMRNPKYSNLKSGVEISELKDTLNRYRLTGPLSNAVLVKALKPSSYYDDNWLGKLFLDDSNHQKVHESQRKFWNELKEVSSPSQLPPRTILGLNIVDPRTNRPLVRQKAVDEHRTLNNKSSFYPDPPTKVAHSFIWDKDLRDKITKSMLTTGELCKLKNKNQLVPGTPSLFENKLQPLPILLLQRPGCQSPEYKRLGFGSGWDVIVPAGYGLSVWLSLIRCGAKSGGWRDTETLASEMGVELFAPDTVSGIKENSRQLKFRREDYFRKPPNKRTNFTKMGITSPFSCYFSQLVKEWCDSEEFHVLRNKTTLQDIKQVLKGKLAFNDVKFPNNAIIPIFLTMDTRGTPGDFGIICLPSKRDIKNSLAKKYRNDLGPIHIEPLIKDDLEKERKLVRTNHKKLLKRLRNRRVRAKRRLQEKSKFHVKIQKSTAEKFIEEQYEQMCEMWLPKKPTTIRNQCSRQVIGYLTNSRFTFSEGKISGIGYITKNGLNSLLNVFHKFKGLNPFFLTRATNSKCFYLARFDVRIDS